MTEYKEWVEKIRKNCEHYVPCEESLCDKDCQNPDSPNGSCMMFFCPNTE